MASNRPNRPRVDSAEVDALRGALTPENDIPAGKSWTPSKDDLKPLRKDAALDIPDFIPERLDMPQNESQRQIADIVNAEREERGEIMPQQQRRQVPKQQPDFDPEVDDPEDVFVGKEGLRSAPPRFADSQGNPIDPRQRAQPKQVNHGVPKPQSPEYRKQLSQEHPVLLKLRERFGISAKPVKDETIGGIRFTFRKYNNQTYTKFVTNMVRPVAETEQEFEEKLGYAVASISIAAINGVPTHEVFGIDIDRTEMSMVEDNPLHPPTSVVVATAESLYPWLISLAVPELGDALALTYGKLFPTESVMPTSGLWRYSCPKKNCNEIHDYKPRYDSEGKMKPYYCSVHGVVMKALGSLEDLNNVPLV